MYDLLSDLNDLLVQYDPLVLWEQRVLKDYRDHKEYNEFNELQGRLDLALWFETK